MYSKVSMFKLSLCMTIFLIPTSILCRKHLLNLKMDDRKLIHITTFGFYKGGYLDVNLTGFQVHPKDGQKEQMAFTVDRTLSDGINPYPTNRIGSCGLREFKLDYEDEGVSTIIFRFDFQNKVVNVNCSRPLQSNVKVYRNSALIPASPHNYKKGALTDIRNAISQQRRRRDVVGSISADPKPLDSDANQEVKYDKENGMASEVKPAAMQAGDQQISPVDVKPEVPLQKPSSLLEQNLASSSSVPSVVKPSVVDSEKSVLPHSDEDDEDDMDSVIDPALQPPISSNNGLLTGNCNGISLPLIETTLPDESSTFSTSFTVYIAGEDCEGLYSLFFHNCDYTFGSEVNINMSVIEKNLNKNYLSAGEMPLPALYFMMSILFFISGCFWVFILKKSKKETGVSVFKIHYLMGALVYLKSFSLLFHSINYHYIQTEGTHVEGWAVLYYITHLLKGALLFITILLIGTGYAFVKHLLSDRDKKIFMLVIPVQIIANVAEIIMDESEEAEITYSFWKLIWIALDLFCCGAILFPVVWSIRHLQEASQTDGKAATNLKKLKLFRHFYIIVVCYIYFSRIIVNMLLKKTVPFQYEWVDEMFREMTTFIFFALTGYKFRPAANNPYLSLAHDSDDETEMDIALTESGLTAGLTKRGYKAKKKTLKEIVLFDPNEEDTDDDEEVLLEKRREASHDFD